MKFFITLLFFIALPVFSQTVLNPGQQYTFDSTYIAFPLSKASKIDSLLNDRLILKEKIDLLNKQILISEIIEDSLQSRLSQIGLRDSLVSMKIKIMKNQDSLLNLELSRYKFAYNDVSEQLEKEQSRKAGTTFWFSTGSIFGIALIYLSSVIVGNIK